jgi:ferritin
VEIPHCFKSLMPYQRFSYLCLMKSLLSTSDLDFLDERGKDEIFASHVYRYGATCFLKKNLLGFVNFCRTESGEELAHRTKLEMFANDMGAELEMPSIPAISFPDETPEGILTYIHDMEVKLLQAYEKGAEDSDRMAVKKLCLDMIEVQTEGVGAIKDLLAEIESTGVGFVNQRLLSA